MQIHTFFWTAIVDYTLAAGLFLSGYAALSRYIKEYRFNPILRDVVDGFFRKKIWKLPVMALVYAGWITALLSFQLVVAAGVMYLLFAANLGVFATLGSKYQPYELRG